MAMIAVDRGREPAPAILQGGETALAYQEAALYFGVDDPAVRQKRFRFQPLYRDDSVRDALGRLFWNKCAFCESPVEAITASPVVHHFRPPQEAVDDDGNVSRPHYWWLAYEWENLYLCCQRCATAAGAMFPVDGDRAPVEARGSALAAEKALLVDPCRDDPDEHLAFRPDGSVEALTDRGKATIEVHALNRHPLVEARRQAIEMALEYPAKSPRNDRAAPYIGAIRQIARGYEPRTVLSLYARALLMASQLLRGHFRRRGRIVEPVARQRLLVERLELRDFRGVEHLVLDLADPDDPAPWTMLLGENGHGKTSVLQALALLLMGREARRDLDLNPAALVRNGASEAEVVAHVRGEIDPRRLRIERGGGMFVSGDDGPSAIAAYGAARIPSTSAPPFLAFGRRGTRPRVENLFDPGSGLTMAQRWLLDLDGPSFDYACRALRQLLMEPEETVVEREDGRVILRTPDGPKHLDQLSDGYRSMIALAADLMSFFMSLYGSMDAAEGLVLVDELSAHLHPRWQMRIVAAFREAFPRLQFVATTHDPLCLRGLSSGREVVVMRRTSAGRVFALPPEEVPSIKGLRVDELLTSEAFGLSSTVDPELESEFDRYYSLLSSHERTAEVEAEIEELKKTLDDHRQLGTTRRERLALEAADAYLAVERDLADGGERERLLEETKQRLQSIWAAEG